MVIYYRGNRKLIQMKRQWRKQTESRAVSQVEKAARGRLISFLRITARAPALGPFPCCSVRTGLKPDGYPVPFLVLPLVSEINVHFFLPHGSQELFYNHLGGITRPYIPQRL